MATIDVKTGKITDSAKVLPDERDQTVPAVDLGKPRDELDELAQWVLTRVRQWRDHRRQNYEHRWDVYERLWRGMWAAEDKSKKSERSTLVTPGLGEAVENIVAEVEEALWGRGDSFDLKAAFNANEDAKRITDDHKAKLKEDLGAADFNPNLGEALINAAVYGSGIGEIVVETFTKREIAASVQAMMPAPMDAGANIGYMDAGAVPQKLPAVPMASVQPPMAPEARVIEREVSYACLHSVNPRNFLIDPTARSIDKALGVAIEEYVGAHIVNAGMRDGKYRRVSVGTSAGEQELGADRQAENEYTFDKVHIIRYYGLVPKHLLFPPSQTVDLSAPEGAEAPVVEEVVDLGVSADGETPSTTPSVDPIDMEMVEACVFVANQAVCIKAIENPYLMKDRPVVAFPWDVVPGRFHGRGVCEKGLVPQRVMDAELRARIDALAYVSAPMMAMDASRLPRGFQLTVRPGKSILTNGDPNTVLRPMHFGQLEQSTFNHSQQLDQMIQRATGSLDVISLAQKSGGDARPGAVSMMLSGIVKRHKRTLMGFVDRFYVPALRKILWRNMQYYPERYEPRNWDFVATGTMGILQREYESQNLASLLNTMEPQSPEYKMILMGIISNTGLTHRRELIDMLKKSIQLAQQAQAMQQQAAADPQMAALQGQMQQIGLQLQIAEAQAKVAELQSRTRLQDAKAQNEMLEPRFKAMEVATKGIYEVAEAQQKAEFDRRLALADVYLKNKDIESNERIARIQSGASVASERVKGAASVASERLKSRASVASERVKSAGQVASAKKGEPQPVPVPVPVARPVPVPVRPAAFVGRGARLTQ